MQKRRKDVTPSSVSHTHTHCNTQKTLIRCDSSTDTATVVREIPCTYAVDSMAHFFFFAPTVPDPWVLHEVLAGGTSGAPRSLSRLTHTESWEKACRCTP
jgi:hypothetical protein